MVVYKKFRKTNFKKSYKPKGKKTKKTTTSSLSKRIAALESVELVKFYDTAQDTHSITAFSGSGELTDLFQPVFGQGPYTGPGSYNNTIAATSTSNRTRVKWLELNASFIIPQFEQNVVSGISTTSAFATTVVGVQTSVAGIRFMICFIPLMIDQAFGSFNVGLSDLVQNISTGTLSLVSTSDFERSSSKHGPIRVLFDEVIYLTETNPVQTLHKKIYLNQNFTTSKIASSMYHEEGQLFSACWYDNITFSLTPALTLYTRCQYIDG